MIWASKLGKLEMSFPYLFAKKKQTKKTVNIACSYDFLFKKKEKRKNIFSKFFIHIQNTSQFFRVCLHHDVLVTSYEEHFGTNRKELPIAIPRAVASLTVPGGQEFHFPQISINFSYFPQTFLIFFLILALLVDDLPTRKGPGYATGYTS